MSHYSLSSLTNATAAIVLDSSTTTLSMEEKLEKWREAKRMQQVGNNNKQSFQSTKSSKQTKPDSIVTKTKQVQTIKPTSSINNRHPLTPVITQQSIATVPTSKTIAVVTAGGKRDHFQTKAAKELCDTVEKPAAKKGRVKSKGTVGGNSEAKTTQPLNIHQLSSQQSSSTLQPLSNINTEDSELHLVDQLKSTGSAPSSPKIIRSLNAELGSPAIANSLPSSALLFISPLAAILPSSSVRLTPSTPIPVMLSSDSTPNTSIITTEEEKKNVNTEKEVGPESTSTIPLTSPPRFNPSLTSSQVDLDIMPNSPNSSFDTAKLINSPVLTFTPSVSTQTLTETSLLLEPALHKDPPTTPLPFPRMSPAANRTPGHRRLLTPRSCGIASTPARVAINMTPLPAINELKENPKQDLLYQSVSEPISTSEPTSIPSIAPSHECSPSLETSVYVYAEVRAHPSIQKKLGTPTFLSPVRRSARLNAASTMVKVEGEKNEEIWKTMLEKTGYAFYPNKVLMQAVEEEKEITEKKDEPTLSDSKAKKMELPTSTIEEKSVPEEKIAVALRKTQRELSEEEFDRVCMPPPPPRTPKVKTLRSPISRPTCSQPSTTNLSTKTTRREKTVTAKPTVTDPTLIPKTEQKEGKKEETKVKSSHHSLKTSSLIEKVLPASEEKKESTARPLLPLPTVLPAPAASFTGVKRNSTPRPIVNVKSRISAVQVASSTPPLVSRTTATIIVVNADTEKKGKIRKSTRQNSSASEN